MISILDTGIANIASVLYALERLGKEAKVTDDAKILSQSSHVILPGVGTASALMANLRQKNLIHPIRELKQPVLGICLGMQMLYTQSEENSEGSAVDCIGIFPGTVTRLKPDPVLAIPHMGWNQVKSIKKSILLAGLPEESNFYFVHSFRAPFPSGKEEITAVSHYGETVPAIIESQNWFGTQFHPERSGQAGEQVLRNFLAL